MVFLRYFPVLGSAALAQDRNGQSPTSRTLRKALAALCEAYGRHRRDCVVRPVVVQPRGRGEGDGICTSEQHTEFIRQTPMFEVMLVIEGIHLTKFWFSVSPAE